MHLQSLVLNEYEDSYAIGPAPQAPATGQAGADRGARVVPKTVYDLGELSTQGQVQKGLNLFLELKSPAQFPALQAALVPRMPDVQRALRELHYVHFARFTPTPDYRYLMVLTEYDGDLRSYVMDFVAVLGDVFNAILMFMKDAPPLPVEVYPEEFWAYVKRNDRGPDPWSAYPHTTVLDILHTRRGR